MVKRIAEKECCSCEQKQRGFLADAQLFLWWLIVGMFALAVVLRWAV